MDRIDHIQIFLRVADTGSFTQAAEQLGWPRASVSLAVQQLEKRLGTRLLHRTTRRVSLTPDGELLVDRARSLVADMEELEQQFQPTDHTAKGRLRVDVPSRIARLLVAPALPDFFTRFPAIELELGSSDRMIDLVQDGVDCALRVGGLANTSLVARPLGTFVMVNCASPAYLDTHGTPRSADDLHSHWAVHYGTGGGRQTEWEWLDQGHPRQCSLRSRVAVNNVETYIASALAGMGLIQVPHYDVAAHLAAGELVEVLPQARAAAMPVHLVYPHRRHLSPRVQGFSRWIEALLAPSLQPLER